MKKIVVLLLVLAAFNGVTADLIELSYSTSVVYSSDPTFKKYDTITYVFRYDTELSAQLAFSDGGIWSFDSLESDDGRFNQCFYADIVSSAFTDEPGASLGNRYNVGMDLKGEDNTIVDAFFYLGSDYHTINIFTESHDTAGVDNGINSWASDPSLKLRIVESIVRSENDTDVVITSFPIRVKPTPPPPPPPPPHDVPEPSVASSLFLGLVFLSGSVGRRFLLKKR